MSELSPSSPFLSVIIPVWNEAAGIVDTLQSLQSLRHAGHELIIVDGGSDDGTVGLARPYCDQVLVSSPGRALQMNEGARRARGDWLLFLHADTQLPPDGLAHLKGLPGANSAWGRFDVRLSGDRWLFRVIARFMNLRSRLTGICTGDQGIFVRRDVFEALGGYRPLPLMEDVELSRRLCLVSRPRCIPSPVTTDSRRWEKGGVWRTMLLMWQLRWRFWRGESPEALASLWRRDVRRVE